MKPVSYIVEALAKHSQVKQSWRKDPQTHAHEELELKLNSQKAARELKWGGRLSLDVALDWTSIWFQQYHAGSSARTLCEHQIDEYMRMPVAIPG
jgi:hypothetical protein